MKIEKWTLGLAAAGLVTLSPALLAQTPPAAPQQVPMLTALSATTISGYVDTSAVWNPGTGNANPAPYAFNAGKQDGFNLNAVDVKISKPQDESGWSAGYTAELSYGPDAKLIDGPNTYPVRQAFVALHMPVGNGIDWQLGRFDNLLGYESSDSYKNPNYTRSYGYSVEPTEHTGLLGTYKFCDAISLQLGVANSVTTYDANTRIGVESKKGYLSLLTLTAPDSWGFLKGSALYAGFDLGQGATIPMAGGNRVYNKSEWYVGTTINTPLKDLTFGASFDSIEHLDVNGQDTGYFAAYAGYMSYKLTDKLTINGRVEYANGSGLGAMADAANGTTISSVNPTPPPATLSTAFNNPMQSVLGLTGTLQYDLWANVITRLEIRWDHDASGREAVDGSSAAFGGTGALGAALPDKKNEVMIAANVIYKF